MTIDTRQWSPVLPEAPGFEHFVVETPGLRSHVAAIGEGEPVVMLHGLPESWWQWRAVAPAVAARGYRVYCPDLRGQGWTEADDLRIGRTTRLTDLLALFDALDLERPRLVSHDLGAITAVQLTYGHSERVRSAVQLSVMPFFSTFHPRLAPAFTHLPRFIWHRPGSSLRGIFNERYCAKPMSDADLDATLAPMSRPEVDAMVRPVVRRHLLPEALRMTAGVYRRKRLTVPTLVVFGRQDRPCTEELLAKICRRPERYADRVEFAFVDDAAHFITDDAPGDVADLILDWFDRTR